MKRSNFTIKQVVIRIVLIIVLYFLIEIFLSTIFKLDGILGHSIKEKFIEDSVDIIFCILAFIPFWCIVRKEEKKINNIYQKLEESEKRYRTVVELSPEPIFLLNKDIIFFANNAGCMLLGAHDSRQIIGKSFIDFLLPKEQASFKKFLKYIEKEKNMTYLMNIEVTGLAGGFKYMEALGISIEYKEKPCSLIIMRDVTERIKKEEEVKFWANHDYLTKLPNRKHFLEFLKQKLPKYNNAAIMYLDLDGFKLINDQYGHEVGDFLLQLVAKRLKNCIRNDDMVSRLGGDEFGIFIVDISHNEAKIFAEKIIDVLKASYKLKDGTIINIAGVSIGISLFPVDIGPMRSTGETDNIDILISLADEAMYVAKKNGGNQYSFYGL
ncbi:MAG: hypothetical protein PWP31_1539 [Clostridia bacterium]|nr:hypothetical protein [Clostridia bacterium]